MWVYNSKWKKQLVVVSKQSAEMRTWTKEDVYQNIKHTFSYNLGPED
jgi:hypothetical protein